MGAKFRSFDGFRRVPPYSAFCKSRTVHYRHALSELGLDWFNKPHSTNQTELVISEPSKLHQVRLTKAYRAYLRASITEQHATGASSTWKGGARPQERR